MMERHYGMDWLRIGAFQLLILYHVGMAFVPWDYQVKLASPPLDWATIPMFLTNPWRLSLLFVVSGYASAALFGRGRGPGAFALSRLGRLGLPLLFAMAVLVTPQPWVWLVTQHGYPHGFGWFLAHDYYRFQMIQDVAVPTWMHLWFVVYLLAYSLVLAGLLALPARWRAAAVRPIVAALATPLLLPAGILWVFAARTWLGWEDTHMFFGDWAAHATYLPAFLFGFALRTRPELRGAVARWWKLGGSLAIAGWAVLAAIEIAYPGTTPAPAGVSWLFRAARACEAWGAIVGLLGLADRHWNRDAPWRAMLAEAVFPFYIIHQTIILVVGYWLLSTTTGTLARFVILVAATAVGCWAFYFVGRTIPPLRPLIGLGPRRAVA
jgi:glucans biosynthesis protein C